MHLRITVFKVIQVRIRVRVRFRVRVRVRVRVKGYLLTKSIKGDSQLLAQDRNIMVNIGITLTRGMASQDKARQDKTRQDKMAVDKTSREKTDQDQRRD